MKKAFSLLMVVMVLVTTLWFSVGSALADATNVIFDAPGATKEDASGALMLEGSDWNPVYCVIRDEQAVCRVGEAYAGTEVWILLGGKTYFVDVPAMGAPAVLTCTGKKVLGADVKFTDSQPDVPPFQTTTQTYFVPGNTLEIVADHAQQTVNYGWYEKYEIVSGLKCDYPPS
jgi:hypothetical protein